MNKYFEGIKTLSGTSLTNDDVLRLEKKFPPVSQVIFEDRVRALTDLMESEGYSLSSDIFDIAHMSVFNGDGLDPRPGGHTITYEKADSDMGGYIGKIRINPWHIWHETDEDFNIMLVRLGGR